MTKVYYRQNFDTAKYYALLGYSISKNLTVSKSTITNKNILGIIYMKLGELDSAEFYYKDAILNCKEIGLNKKVADIKSNML